jgi:GxxExxY protein
MSDEECDPLTQRVIGAAIEVHRELGPGLLESIYQRAMEIELGLQGLSFVAQQPLPVCYKGVSLGDDMFMDFVVEGRLVVELKAVDALAGVHEAQLLTYLKLSKIHTGLLLNFNVKLLKNGLKRMVL